MKHIGYRSALCGIVMAFVFSSTSLVGAENITEYTRRRNELMQREWNLSIGGEIVLNNGEMKVNAILMQLKKDEILESRKPGGVYPPSINFVIAKPLIEKSKVFQIIRSMPKGGLLHIHDLALTTVDWLIKTVTYRTDCYMCESQDGQARFRLSSSSPEILIAGCDWQMVAHLRNVSGDARKFDDYLRSKLTLVCDDPQRAYPTIDSVWQKFTSNFVSVAGLIASAVVFEDYFREGLREMRADNIQYAEIRALLLPIYELNGTVHDIDWTLKKYIEVSEQFTRKHNDFLGTKFIYISSRRMTKEALKTAVKDVIRLRIKFPQYVCGYDLVGQEDKGHSLLYFLDELLYPSMHDIRLPYFFHSGETVWQGEPVDDNLFDALLLNASRIGHGYALSKHPIVAQLLRANNIAIEVNPISNQVLKLVDDLRNHPMASLMTQGSPVVISSDDPAMWGALPLSHDFYEAFMALGGADADLAMLKQLALNSIRYSAMDRDEKTAAEKLWSHKWSQFIEQMLTVEHFANQNW